MHHSWQTNALPFGGGKVWVLGIRFLREHVDPNAQIVDELLKHKYAFGLNRRTRKQLAAMALPYPKGNHADTS